MRLTAWSSNPGVAGSAIHVVSARAYESDSCACAAGASVLNSAAVAAKSATRPLNGERAIDGFGKAVILS